MRGEKSVDGHPRDSGNGEKIAEGERNVRKRERERLRDFGQDESGKVAYLGDHVRLVGELGRSRLLGTLWAAVAVAAAATLVPGVIDPAGLSGCPYVVMPYMLQVVALVSVVWALGRLTVALRRGERVRVYVRDETVGALPGRSALATALALVSAVGEAVYLTLSSLGWGPAEVAFLGCEAVAMVALVVVRRAARASEWEGA